MHANGQLISVPLSEFHSLHYVIDLLCKGFWQNQVVGEVEVKEFSFCEPSQPIFMFR